jgi:hypothetical protein
MLSSMGISAGRFGYSALVIFDKPTPRMSANPSKSRLSGGHGTEFTAPASETARGIACRGSLDRVLPLEDRRDLGR